MENKIHAEQIVLSCPLKHNSKTSDDVTEKIEYQEVRGMIEMQNICP